jgi:hypothetical protein
MAPRVNESFSPSYVEARAAFRSAARAAGATLHAIPKPGVRGRDGERLTVDVAVVAGKSDAALVVVSGTHGIEGYAGSAVQRAWLEQLRHADRGPTTVLVHALNPFGFSHRRRVDEHNVDLNRNFVDHARPPQRADYALVHDALVPSAWDPESLRGADSALIELAAARGADAVQHAIMGGQYTHDDGLFYGGRAPAWSNGVWRRIVRERLTGFTRVACVDVHTGLGPPGGIEAILRGGPGARPRAADWFGAALTVPDDGDCSSTSIDGNTAVVVLDELQPTAEVTAVTLEFGTRPSWEVLRALRAENGVRARPDAGLDPDQARQWMDEAFAPADVDWRTFVVDEGLRLLRIVSRGLVSQPIAA